MKHIKNIEEFINECSETLHNTFNKFISQDELTNIHKCNCNHQQLIHNLTNKIVGNQDITMDHKNAIYNCMKFLKKIYPQNTEYAKAISLYVLKISRPHAE